MVRAADSHAGRKFFQRLNGAGFSRTRWPRSYALLDLAFEPLATVQAYNRIYSERTDPWEYLSNPQERERYRMALAMLDDVRKRRRFASVLEAGCAEGAFTELLAPLSESLLALDFCPLALDRARNRCRWDGTVAFGLCDLRRQSPPGEFELVTAMDLLSSFRRPALMRAVFEKLVAAMRPQGYLLVTEHRQHPAFEDAWWARRLLRGGRWIVSALAQHPSLVQIQSLQTDTHVLALFHRLELPARP
jgi:SAM-dependent methyltransferase